ncbi:hypothetical protein AC244_09455 [Ensifer adhaerens]|uniref:Uncharacterized protein n=1 Tax=Ensifer adhaerens TaxID=106592 RepID=A0A0L8BZM4_ENSAD|nr:hypothetical protein AC244_09455 [Ensifer adhaerens]
MRVLGFASEIGERLLSASRTQDAPFAVAIVVKTLTKSAWKTAPLPEIGRKPSAQPCLRPEWLFRATLIKIS